MMDLTYTIAPFFGYVIAGGSKFIINSYKYKKLALKEIGLGGFPSTHNTVTSTVAALIAFNEGLTSPALAVALCLAFIVYLDSIGLRKHIQDHAQLLSSHLPSMPIRKKLAHSRAEALAGILLGLACGWFLHLIRGSF
jgi:acid phosphatase family membrane protein YuiD